MEQKRIPDADVALLKYWREQLMRHQVHQRLHPRYKEYVSWAVSASEYILSRAYSNHLHEVCVEQNKELGVGWYVPRSASNLMMPSEG